ncbi:MAG: SRPBCC family protein [Ignavibacteria bacterium]|jgi:ligand-binding SRPBCC domain-containing protein
MYQDNKITSTKLNEKNFFLLVNEKGKAIYILKEQILNIIIEEAWNFFSNPLNLNQITPPNLKFKILSKLNGKMHSGQIIEYKIRLLPGVNQAWVTEIKNVKEKEYFIDEQRFGPYKFWYHEHEFEEKNGKVKMTDTVHYELPFGLLGRFVHLLFVKKKLEQIFNYRFQLLEEKFA